MPSRVECTDVRGPAKSDRVSGSMCVWGGVATKTFQIKLPSSHQNLRTPQRRPEG